MPAQQPPTESPRPARSTPTSVIEWGERESMIVTLRLDEPLRLSDTLAVVLRSFTHKRPFVGGTTKVTAVLELNVSSTSSPAVVEEISLSEYGVEGKSPEEDGLLPEARYETVEWKGWTFRLTELTYERSIVVELRRPRGASVE